MWEDMHQNTHTHVLVHTCIITDHKVKRDLIKITNFAHRKNTVKRAKMQATEWRRLFEIIYLTKKLYSKNM